MTTYDESIGIIETSLTDGSMVYAVELRIGSYDAITLADAEALASGINDLIRKHTNSIATLYHR